MAEWEYGGAYRGLDMTGEIPLPNGSLVQVCDWLNGMPAFMRAADTVFVDPPWNIGNVKSFYTKAAKEHIILDFLEFSKVLFQRIDEISPRHLFIEMGKQYLGWYLESCRSRYRRVTFYNSTYFQKSTNKCYVIHASGECGRRYKTLEDLDEAKIIEWLCANHDYKCIGDLCMGRGLVGLHAYRNKKRFVGTELNHKRLAVLVKRIMIEESKRK